MPLFGAAYAAPNKDTTTLYLFRSPKTVLNPPVNGKIQRLFHAFLCFSSTFQGKFKFQGLFKTVLYIQVLFKHVRTLNIYINYTVQILEHLTTILDCCLSRCQSKWQNKSYPWSCVTAPMTPRIRGQPWLRESPLLCNIWKTHSNCFWRISGWEIADSSCNGDKMVDCNFWNKSIAQFDLQSNSTKHGDLMGITLP